MEQPQAEMPRYQCHKQVWALPIREVRQSPASTVFPGGSWELVPGDDRYAPITVSHEWYLKHSPQPGGYYVVYADGYKSYSPASAFEEGYTPVSVEPKASIEQEIQAKGLTAPRVTPADIEAEVVREFYFTAFEGVDGAVAAMSSNSEAMVLVDADLAPLRLLTFCILALRNGFTVTGESACASPENFDPEIGRKVARQAARDKLWPLLGFRLRDQLHARERLVAMPGVAHQQV